MAVLKERLNKTDMEKQTSIFELCTNVYLMYVCEITGAKSQIHKYMVLQCSNIFYFKVSSRFMRQDLQSSYSFGKTQNVESAEYSEEKNQCFTGERFHISFSHFYIYIHIYECRSIYYQRKDILKNNFCYNFILTLYDLTIFLRLGIIYLYKKGQQKKVTFIVPTMNLYLRNGQLKDRNLTHNKFSINLTSTKFETSDVLSCIEYWHKT